jgi:3-oxoacyl-[acyl-carrier-protein] synthase-3
MRLPGQSFSVAGLGAALGPVLQPNADIAERLGVDDAWIRERTGITQRHVGGDTESLAIVAAQEALADAAIAGRELGAVVVATTTPQRVFPATAALVARPLGSRGASFDINAACTGFVHAWIAALTWLDLTEAPVLVVGVDATTKVIDPDVRATAVLFGDGAGAVVLTPGGSGQLLAVDSGTDPELADILSAEHGGTIQMDGRAVANVATAAPPRSIRTALGHAGLEVADLTRLVTHQANQRIIDVVVDALPIDADRVIATVDRHANTAAASIPLALHAADRADNLPNGVLAMCGYGAGMTWATAVCRWDRRPAPTTPVSSGGHIDRSTPLMTDHNTDPVYERFARCVVEALGVDASRVTPDANFVEDLEADSIGLVELQMAIEEEFDMDIPEEDYEGIDTVGAAFELVKRNLA